MINSNVHASWTKNGAQLVVSIEGRDHEIIEVPGAPMISWYYNLNGELMLKVESVNNDFETIIRNYGKP